MKLSVLICSLQSRSSLLSSLVDILVPQIEAIASVSLHMKEKTASPGRVIRYSNSTVELIINIDNRQISTGAKRNQLLHDSSGEYVVFIDDDDWVPDYYLQEMLKGCATGADCLAINGYMTTDGHKEIKWKLSKDYENITVKENGTDIYHRKTNHITAVRREHAIKAMFPDKSNAEDKGYSESVNKYLKTEATILPEMYHYQYSTKNKQY